MHPPFRPTDRPINQADAPTFIPMTSSSLGICAMAPRNSCCPVLFWAWGDRLCVGGIGKCGHHHRHPSTSSRWCRWFAAIEAAHATPQPNNQTRLVGHSMQSRAARQSVIYRHPQTKEGKASAASISRQKKAGGLDSRRFFFLPRRLLGYAWTCTHAHIDPLNRRPLNTHRHRDLLTNQMVGAAAGAEQPLGAVRCPGSLLAALLLDAGKAAGAGGRSEGLLLGCPRRRREEVRGDDVQEAGERTVLETGAWGGCVGHRS